MPLKTTGQNGSVDKDVQMHVYSGSTQGDSFAGSKSNTTFPTSGEKGKTLSKFYVGKRKHDKDDNKLDRLCSLLETVIEHVSPPAKKSIGLRAPQCLTNDAESNAGT